LLKAEPDKFAGVTAESLAAVAVSIIKGCAVQVMIEPDLDLDAFLVASERLLAQLTRRNVRVHSRIYKQTRNRREL
jgi:hypothetical protein